jgi:hypothetical protein
LQMLRNIKPLERANYGFVPIPARGSVQGHDRREPNTCVTWIAYPKCTAPDCPPPL